MKTSLHKFRDTVADIRSFADSQEDIYPIACATTISDLTQLVRYFARIHDGEYANHPILKVILPLLDHAERNYERFARSNKLPDDLVTAAAYILLEFTESEKLWTI